MTSRPTRPEFEPAAGGALEDRVGQYARLRQDAPLAWTRDGNGEHAWSVMRYADVLAVARNVEVFANGLSARLGARRLPLESDPPEHSDMRRLLLPFVTGPAMRQMEPVTRGLAAALIRPLLEAGGGDFAHDVARPLPAQVLVTWIGQPASDWEKVKIWSDHVLPRTFIDDADRQLYAEGNATLWAYSRALVAERRAGAVEAAADPISALLAAGVDDDTAAGVVRLLVSAGHDSTSLALGICVHYLATHPEDQARLRADPAGLRLAIEEILRVRTPVVAMPRTAACDAEVAGRQIRAGDRVLLTWASANLDESTFDAPGVCQLDRAPNPHLAFGHGIHTCLGAPLARQELRVALEILLEGSTAFRLGADPIPMRMNHYGFSRLPLWIER